MQTWEIQRERERKGKGKILREEGHTATPSLSFSPRDLGTHAHASGIFPKPPGLGLEPHVTLHLLPLSHSAKTAGGSRVSCGFFDVLMGAYFLKGDCIRIVLPKEVWVFSSVTDSPSCPSPASWGT